MIAFIPDTSVCMAWCFDDETNPYSEALLVRLEADDEALVPSLWPVEVANALVVAKRRGRVTEVQISGFIEDIAEFSIHIDQLDAHRILTKVRGLADEHRLTSYDAMYLELAMRTGAPLATLDKRLKAAAQAAGVALLEITEPTGPEEKGSS